MTFSLAFRVQWRNHKMFATNTTCTHEGKTRDDAWWAARGGPGFFESYLSKSTAEPLEFRFMTGRE